MDSAVTDDQQIFMDATARFIGEVCPLARVREKPYREPAFAASYLHQAAELGWFSMLVPDGLGGGSVSGRPVSDAALIAYERGKLLQPGPFVPTNVVAYALAVGGSDEHHGKVIPGLLAGDSSAAWASPSLLAPGDPVSTVTARSAGDGYTLSGRVAMVQDADTAAWLLVTADADGDTIQVLIDPAAPGVIIRPLESLDITRSFAEIEFRDAAVAASTLVGTAGDRELVELQLAIASVLTAAEAVGAMDADFSLALQYAKDRIAFGRPIGSFQAVKHLLADTSLLLEMSKAITVGACDDLDADDGFGREAACMAKAFVGDSGMDLAQNCHQVFGGISFTWEHDQHLYLRRITTDAALYGDPDWQRERLCRLGGLEP